MCNYVDYVNHNINNIYILLVSTEEAPEIACKVLSENISTIMKAQIDLSDVLEKLSAKDIINDAEKKEIMDSKNTLNINDRWRKLLDLVQATIRLDEEAFQIFLNVIKDGGTRRAQKLADKLYKVINLLYNCNYF